MADVAAAVPETDRLDPEPAVVKLSNGSAVEILRMRTRQLFRLLKILTHGGLGAGIAQLVDFSQPADVFFQQLVTVLLLSIPDAEQQALEFIAVMIQPCGLVTGKLTDKQRADNAARWDAMNEYLVNPPIDDTISIIEEIIVQEAPEFQALGKRLARTMELFQRTGQDKEKPATAPSNEELASRAASAESPSVAG